MPVGGDPQQPDAPGLALREALLYSAGRNGVVVCHACPHTCVVLPGQRGRCGVRRNDGGVLRALTYGQAAAINVEPIEKKPLFHFLPGSETFSIGTVGCNLECRGCQNWELSRAADELAPEELDTLAFGPAALVEHARNLGHPTLSFTYNEPVVSIEYVIDTCQVAQQQGLSTALITNGYFSPVALEAIAPHVSAMNIDLKSFRESFYREQCCARLQPVLDTIEAAAVRGIWVEVTTLIVPGLNDDPAELRDCAQFLYGISPELPWHVTAFHPAYRLLDRPHTTLEQLFRAWEIGKHAGLKHVYTGNIIDAEHSATYCPQCQRMLVTRHGPRPLMLALQQGCCSGCGVRVAGVWE